jgi:hypothetical protein
MFRRVRGGARLAAASGCAEEVAARVAGCEGPGMRSLGLGLVAVALLGCKMLGKDTSDKSPEAAASGSAAVAPSAPAAPQAERPAGFSLMPVAVGQFVEYGVKGGSGAERYAWAVTGKEGESFWLQLATNMNGQPAVVQMLMPVTTAADINDAHPEKMRFKAPGRGVQEIGGGMLRMAAKYRPTDGIMIKMDPGAIEKGPREDVKVPAGNLLGAYKWQGDTKWQGKRNQTTFWSHPDVPITGIVRGHDGTRTWELAKFGKTGAKDELL